MFRNKKGKSTIVRFDSLRRIEDIHKLSKLLNKKLRKHHKVRLLELMKEHVKEIEGLFRNGNKHYLTETGDLIILCFEMLLENKQSINETLLKCFKRYEKKLPKLIKESHRC